MAITFSATTNTAVGSDSATVSTPTAPGGGSLTTSHLIWAFFFTGDNAKWSGYAAAGWTEVRWQDDTAGPNLHVLVRQATASEPGSYTLGPYGASNANVQSVMFSTAGGNTTTPFQTTSGDDGNANIATAIAPTLTPTSSDAMLFWVGGGTSNNLTNASTATSTGTELFDLNTGALSAGKRLFAGYYEQLASSSATGTRTVTFSQSAANFNAIMFAMNPVSTGPIQAVGMIPLN